MRGWRVAIIDSGLNSGAGLSSALACRFDYSDGAIREGTLVPDLCGHGTRITAAICSGQVTPPTLLVAQALDPAGTGNAAQIAAGVRWASAHRADLIHMSLGLSEDRQVLAQAIRDAVRAGAVVVAATPARGVKPFPASYDGVIAATGDARCGPDEISVLGGDVYADFGGCVRMDTNSSTGRGASTGAAFVTRFIVGNVPLGSSASDVRKFLAERATFHGRERLNGDRLIAAK